ncbi:MAG: hypothetical protein GX952_00075 [Firmicutes bacterium]|nr:hypothetical protein [Bacillota bacterium]
MAKIVYFQSRRHYTPEREQLLKLLPRSKEEGYKADTAEKMLTEDRYIHYLALAMIYRAYDFLPPKQQEHIQNLVDAGILDEIAIYTDMGLTNSCVTMENEFLYNNQKFKLPGKFVPRLRTEDDSGIYVEGVRPDGESRIYKFIFQNGKHHWEQVRLADIKDRTIKKSNL